MEDIAKYGSYNTFYLMKIRGMASIGSRGKRRRKEKTLSALGIVSTLLLKELKTGQSPKNERLILEG